MSWSAAPDVMQDTTAASPLPDYENPPVIETVLGVQFDRLAGFKNAHLGSFWKSLGDGGDATGETWPTVTDVPPLPVQFERFGEAGAWAKGFQFQLTQDPSSRLQIKNCAWRPHDPASERPHSFQLAWGGWGPVSAIRRCARRFPLGPRPVRWIPYAGKARANSDRINGKSRT